MKKNVLLVMVASMLVTTSCMNEIDMFKNAETGTISLNVTNDNEFVATRANVEGDELANWTISVTKDNVSKTYTPSGLESEKFNANTSLKLKAYNYIDDAAAQSVSVNGGRGAARYESGEVSKTIAVGVNSVTLPCGKAKNGKFTVEFDKTFTDIYKTYSLVAKQNGRIDITFDKNTADAAFYSDNTTVNYELSFAMAENATIGDLKKYTSVAGIAITAGKWSKLKFTAADTGKITLTITYDGFSESADVTTTIKIDAATGEGSVEQ